MSHAPSLSHSLSLFLFMGAGCNFAVLVETLAFGTDFMYSCAYLRASFAMCGTSGVYYLQSYVANVLHSLPDKRLYDSARG